LFPFFLLTVVAEYVVRQIPNDYSYKKEYLNTNSENVEILVLGSSHSFYGINPIYFSRTAFNASHLAQSLNYDYFIFNKFKNKLSNLKILILPISYFTLFYQLEKSDEDWRVKNYHIYYDCQYHCDIKYNFETISERPYMVLKKILKYFNGSNSITVSELGFGLTYSNAKQSDLMKTGKNAAKKHTMDSLDLLDTQTYLLNKLIDECNRKGVRVILFTPPARKSYISNLDKHQLSVMKSTIEGIIRKYSAVEYYDFMNDLRFFDEDFKDADHLNGVGAKKLSQFIDHIIQNKAKLAH